MPEEFGVAGFIDVETTGLDPWEHEVVEFSMAIFRFNRETGEIAGIIDEYTGQREPYRSIPKAASDIHGLTKRKLKGKTVDLNRISELGTQCEFFIAHNAQFDRSFVGMTQRPWYCSMRGIDWKGHGYTSMALQRLLKRHGIEPGEAHRANADVRAAIELLSRKSPAGVYFMKELLDHGPMFPAVFPSPSVQEVAATTEPAVEVPDYHEASPGPAPKVECDTHPGESERPVWQPDRKIDGTGKTLLIIMLALLFILVLNEFI